jgi:trans-aconitate 2-methyltransferase
MKPDWCPELYLKFADERSRPARDLLAQVPLHHPSVIYDLGCGPGNSTALLDAAFPMSEIIGIDNSEAMLAKARENLPKREFVTSDLAHWTPPKTANLLFSNATFQWVADHAQVLVRLIKTLPRGGVLALQMPDNLDEPSHVLMRETAQDVRWAHKLADAAKSRESLLTPDGYYQLLKPFSGHLDIWHVIYNHPLDGLQCIADFVSSTGLRPFLDPLDAAEKQAFIQSYTKRLAQFYPSMPDGKVLLKFPRLFIVAQASG